MALPIFDSALRGLNFVFLVIVLGLTGSLIAGQDHKNPQVNFALFAAVFGLVLNSFYGLIANFVSFLAWPVILFIIDFLNLVFTFAGATALAVAIRTHSCTNQDYLDNNNVAQGSTDRCRKAQAVVAFLYFSFFVFLGTFAFSAVGLISGGAFGSSSKRSAPKTGIPTISTV
ncbi:Non-classical export protein 2 [Wickerhamomyces ciferrii]|uniref:Non-classical export protein 2 n=1 Tax=Wickerhamomyces ciferrii (strain ATCC 14091 / BCRC 22168 / CBS 111 / JCM 3599 / NBRC 0793 / NRRL Y-1031 F-60-10) TaxID=1206466 RepID=K0KY10_WICCF|nr:Non-classical export protein 2 [Wickerhamomyces ciferrii]CCH46957.1 Non-classical export protein 2 [Wickerhamomyces ciferrii]